jgi:rhamnosyltransferase
MSEQEQKKVSIVIRCFNEATHIEKLFLGIRQQSFQPCDIVVVDSGSTDRTVAIASKYTDNIIHISPELFSFGYSLNIGIEEAKGDYIAIISAHAHPVYKDWLVKLIEPFSDESVVLVYGRQLGNDTSKYSERMWFNKCFPDQTDMMQKGPFCNNANAIIRKETWKKYKYNEELTGLEDIDWANRVLSGGYKIVYQAKAPIFHLHDETPERIYNRYKREAIALKKILPETKFTLFDMINLTTRNIINDCNHAFNDGVFLLNFSEIVMFRSCQFLGTYHGHVMSSEITSELRNKFYYPAISGLKKDQQESHTSARIDYSMDSSDK